MPGRRITHEDRRRVLVAKLNEGKRVRITPGQRKAILSGSALSRRTCPQCSHRLGPDKAVTT